MANKVNPRIVTKTANYSADISDDVIEMDATGGARSVILPSANFQFGNSFAVVKKDSSANAVTITAAGSCTINGASSYVLARQNQTVELQSDGSSNYRVISQSGSGKAGSSAITSATTIALDTTLNENFTLTPAHTATINAAAVGPIGSQVYLFILTSGTSSFTLTFGTNFLSPGTLATGTVTAKKFLVKFKSDGVAWLEQSRTAAL